MYRLIIVDDEPRAREQLSRFIKWEELDIELVGLFQNGRDALSYIQQNSVDIVISDLKMPVMDGIELAAACRQQKPQIQFVIISAYRDFEFAKAALQHHVKNYVLKPIKYDELYDTIKDLTKSLQIASLESKIEASGFLPAMQRTAIHDLFLRLISGRVNTAQMLKEGLAAVQLPAQLSEHPCILYQMRLDSYDAFIANNWRHEAHMLYTAIDNLIPFEFDNAYITGTKYHHDIIELLFISRSKRPDFEEAAAIILQGIAATIKRNLDLEVHMSRLRVLQSMDEFTGSRPQAAPQNDTIVATVMRYVEKHISQPITLSDIAKELHFNAAYFGTMFKKQTGMSFTDYINRTKMEKSVEYLRNSNISISEISEKLGYKSEAYYYELFKKHYQMTPSQYRKNSLQNQ